MLLPFWRLPLGCGNEVPDTVFISKLLPPRLHGGLRKGDVILEEHCTNVPCPPIKSTNQ